MKKDMFVKSHLAITKDQYEVNADIRPTGQRARKLSAAVNRLNILEVPQPTYKLFKKLIDDVGGPWGWNRRPRYHETNRANVESLLKRPSARLFLLRKDKEIIGYCFTAVPGKEPEVRESLRRRGMSTDMVEIENFGFAPEHTGKKYGRFFLPAMFDKLFKGHDTVYLSTRSTNHDRVIPFYESLGMQVIMQEKLPNDLLPPATPRALPIIGAPRRRISQTLHSPFPRLTKQAI